MANDYRAWLDGPGERVRWHHVCNGDPKVDNLPNSVWRWDDAGRVTPSVHCTACGFHEFVTLGPKPALMVAIDATAPVPTDVPGLRAAAQAVVRAWDEPDVWDVVGVLAMPIEALRAALAASPARLTPDREALDNLSVALQRAGVLSPSHMTYGDPDCAHEWSGPLDKAPTCVKCSMAYRAPVPTDVPELRKAALNVVDVWAEARAADMLPAIERLIAALAASPDAPRVAGLAEAWAAVEAVLPQSKGRWGYSISRLTYGSRGWKAVAAGSLLGEWVEGYGATPVDALNALAARLADIGDTAAPATSTEDPR